MMLLLLAPVAFAVILYLVFLERLQARAAVAPWRESLLAVAVALITETLSLFEAVTRGAVFASWCAAALGLVGNWGHSTHLPVFLRAYRRQTH